MNGDNTKDYRKPLPPGEHATPNRWQRRAIKFAANERREGLFDTWRAAPEPGKHHKKRKS